MKAIDSKVYEDILESLTSRLKEKYVLSHYKDLYNNIQEFCIIHNLSSLEFKRKFWHYFNDVLEIPKCKTCNKEIEEFRSFTEGYAKYCSSKCGANNKSTLEKREETCLKKYSVTNVSKLEEIKEKSDNTNLEKYGVKHSSQSSIIKQKTEEMFLEKYGVKNPSQLQEFKDKQKQTLIERYGVDYYKKFREKQKQTCQEKYNKQSATGTEQYNEKVKQTCQEKYGEDHWSKSKSVKEKKGKTMITKYGVKTPFQDEEVKKRMRLKSLDKYNTEHPSQSEEVKRKVKQTMIKRYGSDNPRLLCKSIKTSKIEEEIRQQVKGEKFNYNNREYDIRIKNILIEIDGDFYHPSKIKDLTFTQLNSVLNDFRKVKVLEDTEYTLYRIYVDNLPKIVTLDSIIKNSYTPNYEIEDTQIIINKDYLTKYYITKGEKKYYRYISLVFDFIREWKYFVNCDDNKLRESIKTLLEKKDNLTINSLKTIIYE